MSLPPIEQRPAHMRVLTGEQILQRSLKRVREQIDAHFAAGTLAKLERE